MPRGTKALVGVLTLGMVNLALAPGLGSAGEKVEPVGVALDHLRQHPQRYGVTRADLDDLVVTDAYRSAHTGVTHVYVRQRVRGLEVRGAEATVNVTRNGGILHVGSHLMKGVGDLAAGRVTLDAARAATRAARHLTLRPADTFRVLRAERTGDRSTLLSGGGISRSPIPARLVYQSTSQGAVRLAWNLEIEERSQEHWWNVSIDAQTGALLARADYVDHDNAQATASAVGAGRRTAAPLAAAAPSTVPDGSSYRVFALPFESPNDGPRTLVQNPADIAASPFGWHDTNGAPGAELTTTQGNNVHAYLDTTNTGTGLPLTDANGGSGLDFDFAYDPSLPPTTYKDAAVTNLFYWNNIIHDVFYRYGFDEASGNFQVNNYGRGGAAADSVMAEAQDGSGTNNANFATPVDGSRPRMQMYVWTSTFTANRQLIDGDFDSGVITHEYGHGISNRLTGGPATGGCLSHQEREGEGWSDWLALALTTLPGETGTQPRGMGPFVLGQPSRQGAGIRPTRYSTNMAINGTTYDDIKTLAVPHGVGYAWATMLWEVYWDLIAKHGFNPNVYEDWTTGGNNLAIQLVMDGMKLQPCSPGFVDARDGVLAADVALTGGQNQCLIWRGFSKRGLGFSADQGSPTSRTDGTEAFDTHPDCRPRAGVSPGSLTAVAPLGGTATATLTVSNGALADGQILDWAITESGASCSAAEAIDWVSAAPALGSTAGAGASEVTVTFDAGGFSLGESRSGHLCVGSNDEAEPVVAVPVTLTAA